MESWLGGLVLVLLLTACLAGRLKPSRLFNCGSANSTIIFQEGQVTTDPIAIPSKAYVTVTVEVTKDLPRTTLGMKLTLDKLEPFRMPIPCWSKFGSCTHNVCKMITTHQELLCPAITGETTCSCPISRGTYSNRTIPIPLPRFPRIITKILQGNYEGNLTFFNTQTKKIYGCVGMEIGVKAA